MQHFVSSILIHSNCVSIWRAHLRIGGVTAAILPKHSGNRFSALAPYFPSSALGAERGGGEGGLILCHVAPPAFAYTFLQEDKPNLTILSGD